MGREPDRKVSVQLFGAFTVTVDGGEPVGQSAFERRTGAELVQLLALTDGHRLHRDQLIDALWPETDIDRARNAFYKAATYARRALHDDAVQVKHGMVTLFDDWTITVDVEVIEQAHADDPASVDAALAAWRQPLLPSVPYADWAIQARDRTRQRLIALLGEAERWAELFDLDPTHEGAGRALMAQALGADDPAAALGYFRRLDATLRDELGVGPAEPTLALRDRAMARRTRPTDAPPSRPGRAVPPPAQPLLGRDDDRAAVERALGAHRLVTVVGPGGVGKTALAQAIGAEPNEGWLQGARWCRLGTAGDGRTAAREMLAAIGGQQWQDCTVEESIIRTLATESSLLVLDNCEQLIDDLRPLVADILAHCPGVRCLATSRRPLGLPDEFHHRLGRLSAQGAAALFQAEALRHGLTTADDDPAVERICERLDRLPLALRLGAARAGLVGLNRTERYLADRFRFLAGAVDVEPHKTLEEAIAWSVEALEAATADVLRSLSILVGRFTLDTALAVAGIDDPVAMIDHLDELTRASLIERTTADGEPRHRLLESVRLYARGMAEGDGSAAAAVERHRHHMTAGAERASRLLDDDSAAGLRWFANAWPDIRQAAAATLDGGSQDEVARLVAACGGYAVLTLRFEVIDWCEGGLEPPGAATSAEHAVALATWAVLDRYLGRLDRSSLLLDAAARVEPTPAEVLLGLAMGAHSTGDADRCVELLTAALEAPPTPATEAAVRLQLILVEAGRFGDTDDLVHRLSVLAAGRGPIFRLLDLLGRGIGGLATDPQQARTDLLEARALADGLGTAILAAQCRTALPMAAVLAGQQVEALRLERDAVAWTAERGAWSMATSAIGTLALLLDGLGDTANAVTLISARVANGYATAFNLEAIHAVADRARVDHPDRFEAWWDAGTVLDHRGAAELGIAASDAVLAAQPPEATAAAEG